MHLLTSLVSRRGYLQDNLTDELLQNGVEVDVL